MQVTRNDHAILISHMRQAMVTGMSKERAKIYANAQIKNLVDINHLNVR